MQRFPVFFFPPIRQPGASGSGRPGLFTSITHLFRFLGRFLLSRRKIMVTRPWQLNFGSKNIKGSTSMKKIQIRILGVLFWLAWMIPQGMVQAAGAQAAPPPAKKAAKSADELKKDAPKLDINSASKEDLMKLSGIGTAYADAITKHPPSNR